ncbi:MAG: citramalate synthase [Deltaproteobacteria bacterium]|nr:MAG: citramalate synthase [Deltaproteobacteria bacterium]
MIVKLYDTTLRDGTQAEDISFSAEDKVRIALRLDDLGVHYIEGGWPGSNPKDIMFFEMAAKERFLNSKLCAFGSTCRADLSPEDDPNVQRLLSAGTPVCTIFGKTWDLHVTEALRIPLDKNLEIIEKTVAYLSSRVEEVIYDAEHFFDGFKANPEYSIETMKAAARGGAKVIVLCDTNGGSLPWEIGEMVKRVRQVVDIPLGIHCHNDGELAVANTLMGVDSGVTHVQGTFNGYGERCGNANLVSIIPTLMLKQGHQCLPEGKLGELREVSRYVDELANLPHDKHQPFVGDSAFAHKGGVHVSGVMRNPLTYEHIDPSAVGNRQRILLSDLAGKASVLSKAEKIGISINPDDPAAADVLEELKRLEGEGYMYEGAEASFEILLKKRLGLHRTFFDLVGFRVIDEKRAADEIPISEAAIMVSVGGEVEHTASLGNGPVNALDCALRKALEKFYPSIKEVRLVDFKVRVLEGDDGTGARVRVLIESSDGKNRWGTVGVSQNIIQASYLALVDSIEYKLLREESLEEQ